MQVKHLHHKMGGRITVVHAVGHETDEGVPYWFYVCDVEWSDGKKSSQMAVPPDRVCCDGSNAEAVAEVNELSELLNTYLRDNGTWLKKAKWIGDRLVHWAAKHHKHSLAI